MVLMFEETIEYVQSENSIFILNTKDCLPQQFDCKNCVAVVNSDDTAVKELVFERHLRAITCGRQSSDTITLTSLTAESAMIALQRPIQAFDGSITEPFEVPVSYTEPPENAFSLLAVAATFCLMGKANPLFQTTCWHIQKKKIDQK